VHTPIDEIKKIENVMEAQAVHGIYDIVAKIEAETIDRSKNSVNWKIRHLNKVRHTHTTITIEQS
jgi:DNA-binding Lrp family transcriptional regulator